MCQCIDFINYVLDPLDPLSQRNPVIDRLTGQQHNALRNESYYRVNKNYDNKFMINNTLAQRNQ